MLNTIGTSNAAVGTAATYNSNGISIMKPVLFPPEIWSDEQLATMGIDRYGNATSFSTTTSLLTTGKNPTIAGGERDAAKAALQVNQNPNSVTTTPAQTPVVQNSNITNNNTKKLDSATQAYSQQAGAAASNFVKKIFNGKAATAALQDMDQQDSETYKGELNEAGNGYIDVNGQEVLFNNSALNGNTIAAVTGGNGTDVANPSGNLTEAGGAGGVGNKTSLGGGLKNAAGNLLGNAASIGVGYMYGNTPKWNTDNKAGKFGELLSASTKGLYSSAADAAVGTAWKLNGMTGERGGTADAYMDAASNVMISSGNPYLMAAGFVSKGADMLFGSLTRKIHMDQMLALSGSYTGSASDVQKGVDKSGKVYGWASSLFGEKDKANNLITEAEELLNRITNLLASAQKNKSAASNATDMFSRKNTLTSGGTDYLYNGALQVAMKGAKILSARIGGKLNVIPTGALHARKHSLNLNGITKKGIPVVTFEDGGVNQHAEIEVNEIIFSKETTDLIEDLRNKYNNALTDEERDKIAIYLGKVVTLEILKNTKDYTKLIKSVK